MIKERKSTKMCHDLSDRKKMILRAVIEAHIQCGEPVGSKFLAENEQIALSSATIRNELADLTDKGYLSKPHTSSGRVPSEKGYRFYVDTLMDSYQSTSAEITELNELLRQKSARLDKIIDTAGRLVSNITNYPGIAVRSTAQSKVIRRFNIMQMSPYEFMLLMLLDDNTVKSRSMQSPVPLSDEIYAKIQSVLNENFANRALSAMTLPEMMMIEESLGEYGALLSPIIKSVYKVLGDDDNGDVRIEGVDRLLEYPEFTSVDKLKAVLSTFDKKQDLLQIVERSNKNGVNVLIGSEIPTASMSDSTIVFKNITVNGNTVGAIGVIGPCRMDYSKVISTIERLSEALSLMLQEQPKSLPQANNGGKDD